MLTKITTIIKKLVLGFFMLYGYNILVPATAIIPINIITVILTTIFGLPALIFLILIKILIY